MEPLLLEPPLLVFDELLLLEVVPQGATWPVLIKYFHLLNRIIHYKYNYGFVGKRGVRMVSTT